MILTMPWLGAKFVGWENYWDLATDPVARGSFVTSLLFVAVTTPIEVLVGLAMALVLNESFHGRGWLREPLCRLCGLTATGLRALA